VRNQERVVLIGANGSGKSTLIKILLGEVEGDSGRAVLGSSIKLGYLSQNILFNDENSTVLECFRDDISITEGKAREYLARYMFFGETVFKKVGSLSGGERSRLMMSKLMFKEINLLILDEPTNHLDIEAREELEQLLKEFEGTVFFISHDRYFINNIAGKVVELAEGKLTSYEGNYEYYKEKKQENKTIINEVTPIKMKEPKKVKSNEKAESKSKEKRHIEIELENLEEKLNVLEKAITETADNYEKLNELYNEKVYISSKIEELMAAYFEM
jgi:ATPase subunit of ABC transporter with duplicated ATPase domains